MIMSQVPQDMALDLAPFLEKSDHRRGAAGSPLCEGDSLQLQHLTAYPC